MTSNQFFNKLLRELSYRSTEGYPILAKKEHQDLISDILSEWGLGSMESELIQNLTEGGEEDSQYKHVGQGFYVKASDEGKEGAQKFTKDDNGKYSPVSDDEYEKQKNKAGEEGGPTNNPNAEPKEKGGEEGQAVGGEQPPAEPEKGTSLQTPESQERFEREAEAASGEVDWETTFNNVIKELKSEIDDILSGKKNPPGTGGSAIGEMYGGTSLKELSNNSEIIENEFVDNHFEEVRNSSISDGMSDNDITRWLKISYRTGKNELKELTTNPKYKYKNPQTDPFPTPVMDPVNENGSAKKNLISVMEAKLTQAQESGDETAVKHYERQLRFIKARKDTDSGILYETTDGFIGFKHTSNKSSFKDTVFNSTVRQRAKLMNEESDRVSEKYGYSEEEAKKISGNIENITGKGVEIIQKAGLGPSGTVNANVQNPVEFSKENKLGKLFKNLDGGQGGRKNYIGDIQSQMKTNTKLGKKVNDYLKKQGIEQPYDDDQIAGALLGLAKDGDTTNVVTKMVTKLSDNVAKVREIRNTLRKKYPNKSDEEILQLTKQQINNYNTKDAVPFDDDAINVMVSPEMDWVESVGSTSKNAMKEAYKQISSDIADADEKWQKERAPNSPQPPENGPHTQTYVNTFVKQMHWDRYILGEEEDIGDMNIEGRTVNSKHIRTCLGDLSKFTGDLDTKEGRDGLLDHLGKTMKINSEDESLVFQSESGTTQIGKESYRTKGTGNNSLLGLFGKDMEACLKEKTQN